MTPELNLVVWSAVLAFVQMLVAVSGAQLQVGLPTLAGNREDLPTIRSWAGRARRAHLNMIENLLLFMRRLPGDVRARRPQVPPLL